MRDKYLAMVDQIGGEGTRPACNEPQITFDNQRIEKLASRHLGESLLTDILTETEATPHEARVEAMAQIIAAKRVMATEEPEWLSLFDFVIHTLFYQRSKSSGGGSASASIGVIWCANRRTWTQQEAIEFLVHEFAHNLLFIDERAHRHYTDFNEIAKRKNWAKSAVLLIDRPLDKALHSAVVGYDVLMYRESRGLHEGNDLHPDSSSLARSIRNTMISIKNVADSEPLITERAWWIINQIEAGISKLELPIEAEGTLAA